MSEQPWHLRNIRALIYAGLFVDSEVSWFLPSSPKTVIGGGLGGGPLADLITPYVNDEPLSRQEFNVGSIGVRIFAERELANLRVGDEQGLPLNVRLTYAIARGLFSRSGSTAEFVLPPSFSTQSVLAEFRLGGIEPGLTAARGLEVYTSAEEGFRSGFRAFGPEGAPYPEHDRYRTALVSLAAKIPVARSVYSVRLAGAWGEGMDELSAWKVGGNCLGVEPFLYPLHGYYTQEFLAEDFGILNLAWSHQILDDHRLAVHVYADRAATLLVPPNLKKWYDRSGVGAGIGFRGPGSLDWLVSYGDGINANHDGGRDNQEFAVALERAF